MENLTDQINKIDAEEHKLVDTINSAFYIINQINQWQGFAGFIEEDDSEVIEMQRLEDLKNLIESFRLDFNSFLGKNYDNVWINKIILDLKKAFEEINELMNWLISNYKTYEKQQFYLHKNDEIKEFSNIIAKENKRCSTELDDHIKVHNKLLNLTENEKKKLEYTLSLRKASLEDEIKFTELHIKGKKLILAKLNECKDIVDNIRCSLNDLLTLEGENWNTNKILSKYKAFIVKYEYTFSKAKKMGNKIEQLLAEIKKLSNKVPSIEKNGKHIDNKQDSSSENQFKETLPKELESLFVELDESGINHNRLKTILAKIYNKAWRCIPLKYTKVWKDNYGLSDEKYETLIQILKKVFIVNENDKWLDDNLDWNLDEENWIKNDNIKAVDFERKSDLENLELIYNKLINKEINSEEFYVYFLNILKKYLQLQIDDEQKLINQLKAFESSYYFFEDILKEWKITIMWLKKLTVLKYWNNAWDKIFKFSPHKHSGIRIIISKYNKIIEICNHKTYAKYHGYKS